MTTESVDSKTWSDHTARPDVKARRPRLDRSLVVQEDSVRHIIQKGSLASKKQAFLDDLSKLSSSLSSSVAPMPPTADKDDMQLTSWHEVEEEEVVETEELEDEHAKTDLQKNPANETAATIVLEDPNQQNESDHNAIARGHESEEVPVDTKKDEDEDSTSKEEEEEYSTEDRAGVTSEDNAEAIAVMSAAAREDSAIIQNQVVEEEEPAEEESHGEDLVESAATGTQGGGEVNNGVNAAPAEGDSDDVDEKEIEQEEHSDEERALDAAAAGVVAGSTAISDDVDEKEPEQEEHSDEERVADAAAAGMVAGSSAISEASAVNEEVGVQQQSELKSLVVLPPGKIGISFKGIPPRISKVHPGSFAAQDGHFLLGQTVTYLRIPGKVERGDLTALSLGNYLKDNIDVEGREITLEKLDEAGE
eukprot:CAMPEP_0197444856 /NCGR_PEP_ID=MMETSP1175-20131217/10215_1 /TAXON_ID=1003142 /ORGANISM="Triceratium dubium, Strain CCMP147" /LENGTH=419 /DNA_ID=CAMNT_0042975717 /DNA_START=108 /DNA_END=1367 /DNA_ORIENTATION=+